MPIALVERIVAKKRSNANQAKTTTVKEPEKKPEATQEDDRLVILSYAQAGRLIGKSRDCVRRWVNDGLIPKTFFPSGLPGVRKVDLYRVYGVMIENNKQPEK